MSRYPFARIDLAALKHNLQQVRQYAPDSKVMSVIKADAYGHGFIKIAKALNQSDAFAVARLSEALALRQNGFQQPITIFEGVSSTEEWHLVSDYGLTAVLHQQQHLDSLINAGINRPLPAIWLMLETGMHRLGLPEPAIQQIIHQLEKRKDLVEQYGLMSHFANSDLLDDLRNQQQLAIMHKLAESTGLPVCMANSAAIISLPESHYDWVRPGLMLYGASPFADKSGADLRLKPVMQLVSKLIATQQLKPGDQVGYGGQWTADKPMRMGVVSIGYGDGYSRHLSNAGTVMIRGQYTPIIGRVSMDTICINLNDCPQAQLDDEVIIWGADGVTVEWLAEKAGTIPYELLTCVTPRVQREYLNG
ncbi:MULTISPECIES: alanine racemase [unclassified Methylophaga]|uniref:alanine racemase n=1 Tax=unclassified Methylophaga TaxID=2629249 RepID=UPI000C8CAE36|nr:MULTISPECIES: alanine racemase [unclassified Methylophaga]MBN47177.1 alanine racemase [Methylophaga sp.]